MPTLITTEALPNNTIGLTLNFTDEAGSAVVPNAGNVWSLTDTQGNIINSRSDLDITEASSVTIALTGDDLAATGVYDDGIRFVVVEGDYDSDLGNGLSLNATHQFVIGDNIKPVCLDDAKRHLNIGLSNTDHNLVLAHYLASARSFAETFTNRKLLTQTVTRYFDNWPSGDAFVLPYGNLQSVTSVKYTDTAANQSTFSSDDYWVETDDEPGRIVLKDGKSWPTTTLKTSKPIEVIYVCGYGDMPGDVPYPIRAGILINMAGMFEQREPHIVGAPFKSLPNDRALLSPYKLYGGFE